MFFTYFIDAGASDSARVYISNDGATWNSLTSLSGLNNGNGWLQAKLDLSTYAGDSTLRLRFDFTTGVDPQPSSSIVAENGNQLTDGNTLTVTNNVTTKSTTFEFDLGGVLNVPAGAGGLIYDKQTITVSYSGGSQTFTLYTQGEAASGSTYPILISPSYSPVQVADAIGAAITADLGSAGISVQYDDNRVEIVGATSVSVSNPTLTSSTTTLVTLEGDGVGVKAGNVAIPLEFNTTATALATEMKSIMDGVLDNSTTAVAGQDNSVIIDPTTVGKTTPAQPGLMNMYGYTVASSKGSLPFSNAKAGNTFTVGQDNSHEGVYIDDIVIGFTERGEMITGAMAADTIFSGSDPAKAISTGDYVLEIRRGPQYGTIEYPPWVPISPRQLVLDQSFDVNDRLTDSITLETPAGTTIHSGDKFTITAPRCR